MYAIPVILLFISLVIAVILLTYGINRYRGDFDWANMRFNARPKHDTVAFIAIIGGIVSMAMVIGFVFKPFLK